MDENKEYPSPDQVKAILNDVYNKWFTKHKNASTPEDYEELRREAIELDKKYPFELCHVMVLELMSIINSYAKEANINGE